MKRSIAYLTLITALTLAAGPAPAQVYSPKVLAKDQVDTSDLASMARGIYLKAGAATSRQKAEAIWRFFLTDGRFVPPGFWYHIAGWTYEEPDGEVLDPLKLLNSYGFGLCYHIAPLLQAVYLAGGFEDARVWFLTGHTVAEVWYDGAYHHYDSDMLGYTTVGEGDPGTLPVASVSQIAEDGQIILSKLRSPKAADPAKVDSPWYPADLKEAAMESGKCLRIRERAIPVAPQVKGACDLLGLDPLYVANEGIAVAVVDPSVAKAVLGVMRHHPYGANAHIIGTVEESPGGMVLMETLAGGTRIIEMLQGEQLPRIC